MHIPFQEIVTSTDKQITNLVNKETCKEIAIQLGLKKFIRTGNSFKNIKSSDDKILSDCCEALIGAIYIDQGLLIAEKFIIRFWKSHLETNINNQIDPKTKLQEYSLKKYKTLPKYKSRALIYQSILLSDDIEKKLRLAFLLKKEINKSPI